MGVGGGVFTSDKELAKKVRMYRDWGRQADTTKPNTHKELPADYNPRFIYEKIGYNFQILELQAAMGRVQLRKAEKIKKMRKKNFDYLVKHLSKFPELIMPKSIKGADICWFALPLTTLGHRGQLIKHLEDSGIETRSMFAGNITRHPAYKGSKYRVGSTLKEADFILHQSFWIGVHPRMTLKDLKYVVKVFSDYYAKTS
jgi:dTDP-4-amino-4,6-dideoxygalactose transaminase